MTPTNCSTCNKNLLNKHPNIFGIVYDYPIFSIKYLTNNKKFNFNSIPENELKNFKIALVERIQKIEENFTMQKLFSAGKLWCEKLTVEQLKFNPIGLTYSNDTKVYVFHIMSDYRMICMLSDTANIFHIIGFDFRFNAYNHGS